MSMHEVCYFLCILSFNLFIQPSCVSSVVREICPLMLTTFHLGFYMVGIFYASMSCLYCSSLNHFLSSVVAELFDLSFFEGETLREWLFFDQARRAFVSGNRKQRSLPDYNGRGWHESRKQVMKEHGGQKRSYYMDPQPLSYLEWHLYEYEINSHDNLALYRLELKLVDKKKSPKAKLTKESLADLQKKMGKLSADVPADDKSPVGVKIKAKSENDGSPENETKTPERF